MDVAGMATPSSTDIPRRGYFYVILAALLWAVSGSSAKFLFNSGITAFQLVQMRLFFAVCVLLFWLIWRKPALLRIHSQDLPYFLVLGIVGMAMVQFTYLYTISKIKVAAAILLQYLAPAFIALYAVIVTREKLTRTTLLAVSGATAGCYLVVGAYSFNLLSLNKVGIISGLLSAVSYAWYAVHGERGMRRYPPWTVHFYSLLFAAVFWNVVIPPLQFIHQSYSPVQWVLIGYIAILGTLVPFGLYLEAINLIRSTRASITATLEPITAGLIAYLFLGETLQPLQLLGGIVVIASVILLQMQRESDEKTPARIRAEGRRAVD
jgi:drug/metabolite transporter, DME family